MKTVMRLDPDACLFRLCRWTWNRGTVGDGKGYSCKLSLALTPRLFGFRREYEGWILTILGLRMHFAKSFGGIFTALLLVLFLTPQADAQGPLRRLLFGHRFAAPNCASGQCEMMPALAVAPVQPKAVCPCGKAECQLCCPDGKCCEAPGVVGDIAAIPMRSLDPKSFAGALQQQLAAKKKLGLKPVTVSLAERKILNILNGPDSAKRDRQIRRMERHVRAELDLSPTAAINWNADIDWPTLLGQILRLLVKLLPLFL